MSLVDDLENSFQACLAPIVNPLTSHVLDNDELKANLDNIQRFLDISQQIESFFIRKRAILSEQKPELALNEDLHELKYEIARKDMLLNHYYDKLNSWSNVVNEALSGRQQPMMIDSPNVMMPGMAPQMARMGPATPGMMPQMNPNHMQHASNPMMRSQSGGMVPSPVPMGQQPPPQHPQSVFNPMNNSMQSPAQNPLAYLERTTAHIGMNDNRR